MCKKDKLRVFIAKKWRENEKKCCVCNSVVSNLSKLPSHIEDHIDSAYYHCGDIVAGYPIKHVRVHSCYETPPLYDNSFVSNLFLLSSYLVLRSSFHM
ncbi:hypothetical protein C5167_019981 [Papaver somniferum]|uniref:C2H2-type domain-containing protein n=1 Tax=Papaver somniferum TaxID=3469 RepID=A0A4Y7IUU6_PAPSO|nr:hypothetical protein C5167_019981 [Papaver somniferum]